VPFLTPANPIPVLFVLIIALFSAQLLVREDQATAEHKFVSIDGLRGILALLVFVHHTDYWFHYIHQEGWVPTGTIFFNNLGQTSVCLFFMLSGFLFTYKLLEGRCNEINWLRLYCSRFLRLTPLYICVVVLMIVIILLESHFTLKEDMEIFIRKVTKWLLFTAQGHPNINKHPDTNLMTAGVVWTLTYEWYFYFCLPLLAVFIGTKSKTNSGIWLIGSCFIAFSINMDTTLLYGFLGGGAAAFIAWQKDTRQYIRKQHGNFVLPIGLILSYAVIDPSNSGAHYLKLIILTICMAYIACGSSLFDLLNLRATRALSTISYGIHLLHGLLLYMVMSHLIPTSTRINLSEENYWLIIFACTPFLIGLAAASWYLIEKPAIKFTAKLTQYLEYVHKGTTGKAEQQN
jgi:peptidoglycan/LPS O-acetylase OafA/YrhL